MKELRSRSELELLNLKANQKVCCPSTRKFLCPQILLTPQFFLNIHDNDDWALNDKFSYLPRLPFCPLVPQNHLSRWIWCQRMSPASFLPSRSPQSVSYQQKLFHIQNLSCQEVWVLPFLFLGSWKAHGKVEHSLVNKRLKGWEFKHVNLECKYSLLSNA